MRQEQLRILRVVLALLFILSTGFIFLDFRELLPTGAQTGITFLQFLPSVIKFFTTFSLVSAGFIAVLLLTSLFGRVYCSAICPLGILQDLVSRIRRWTGRKIHQYRFGKPHNSWRYSFLALPVIILLTGGTMLGINLLDPYSIFGRIFSDLGQPAYLWINNRLAGLFESMNAYFLYPEDITPARGLSYVIPSGMLIIVVWFSFYHGRLYCNTVCPVGTLLGLISRVSVFRIKMIESRCTKCAKCVFACKASCIDVKNLYVDFSRCVGCFNCLAVCPEDAIKYLPAGADQPSLVEPLRSGPEQSGADQLGPGQVEPLRSGPEQSEPGRSGTESLPVMGFSAPRNKGRREAIIRMLATGLAVTGLSRKTFSQVPKEDTMSGTNKGDMIQEPGEEPSMVIENKIPTEIEPVKHFPVSPPGSLGLHHFTKRCTACHLCISACPTRVLQPSLSEYGLAGIMQPYMDYSTNYCNFDCVRCSEVCPTGAILSLSAEAKKTTQLGQVHLILENCVVYSENTACGSCSEHCPTQAVTMVPYRDGLTLPEIKPEICVGCGACEYACPTSPHKAIYVDGHEVHQVAEKPEIKELEQIEMEDFPF